jgi:hypothetical protein
LNTQENPTLPFSQAADKESVQTFFEEIKLYLSSLQETIEASFSKTKATFSDLGQYCYLHLYEDVTGQDGNKFEHRFCSLGFVLNDTGADVSCIGKSLSWSPDQKEDCFKQISSLVMKELSDYDQKNLDQALRQHLKPMSIDHL